jgi:hypothetical protein
VQRSAWNVAERILAEHLARACSRPEQIRIERQLIKTWLPVVEGRVRPTRPGIDEPPDKAERRWERARVIPTRLLLLIYRRQIAENRAEESLRRFFADKAEQKIWSSRDPVTALRKFLGPPRRGAPKRHAARDDGLAAEIQALLDTHPEWTVDDACHEMEERLSTTANPLKDRTLRNLYFRQTDPVDKAAIRALVEVYKLRRDESP